MFVISADSHIDLHWLPPTLFVDGASSAMKNRVPHVIPTPQGDRWVTRSGVTFGLAAGVGATGRLYSKGMSHRADRMAEAGIYADGAKGILRLSDPELRIADQDRDGVSAEVLYGMLGAAIWIKDQEASYEIARIYNDWIVDFCRQHPERLLGLAFIPTHTPEQAAAEIRRVVSRGGIRGLDIAGGDCNLPLFHSAWDCFWRAIDESGLPVHFHTLGPSLRDMAGFDALDVNRAKAEALANCQYERASLVLRETVLGGIFEKYPSVKLVLSEAGVGWVPYILERMDLGWEDQYRDLLTLKRRPSEYWFEHCYVTYQAEAFGSQVIQFVGEDNLMWASDFPHPDGLWPDSQTFINSQYAAISPRVREKVVGGNAAKLYGIKRQQQDIALETV